MTIVRSAPRRIAPVSFAALAIALLPVTAFAQASTVDSDSGISEIVVTAQRREENLQNVPISVSAFGAEEIAKKGLTDVSRLEGLAPR